MFRFAFGQLVLVALTAIVGAQSIGSLKPEGSSHFPNVGPVVSVLQQVSSPGAFLEAIHERTSSATMSAMHARVHRNGNQMDLDKAVLGKKKHAWGKDKEVASLKGAPMQEAPDSVVPDTLDAHPAEPVPAATVANAVAADPPTATELKKIKAEVDWSEANIQRIATEQMFETRLEEANAALKVLWDSEQKANSLYYQEKMKAYPAYRHKMAVKVEAAKMNALMREFNVKEDAVLQKAWKQLVAKHKVEQSRQKRALDRYDKVMNAKYSCTTGMVQDKMRLEILSKRRTERATLYVKDSQEKKLFIRRMKCMQHTPGDQSGQNQTTVDPRIAACMKAGALIEKATVAQYQGVSLKEKAAVKKQVDRFPQMQEYAMNAPFQGLFNTGQKYEQMEDTWDKDHKKDLQRCKKVVDVEENHAAIVSEFKDALAHAKKVTAEASEALAKKPDA